MQDKIDSIRTLIDSVVYEYLGSTGTRIMDFAGNIVLALLILLCGFKLVHYLVKLADKMLGRSNIDHTLHTFILSFMRIGLKILVILWAVGQVGVATSSIIALLGSAGVAVGLSLQGSLANIAGGVILLLMKPFEAGDYILEDSSGKEGVVRSVGIMYTKLISPENKTILIPNGNLSNSSITNYTAEGNRRVKIQVGIGYDEDIRKVRSVLQGVMKKEITRIKDRPVQIFVDEFQDSSICMGIQYWTEPDDYWMSKWKVQEAIKMAFDENGISIPYNRLDVQMVEH